MNEAYKLHIKDMIIDKNMHLKNLFIVMFLHYKA